MANHSFISGIQGGRFALRTSPVDAINLLFLAVNVVFFLFAFDKTPYRLHLPLLYLFSFSLVVFMMWLRGKRIPDRAARLVFFAYPVVFLFVIFESFFMSLPYFNPNRYDAALIRMDFAILGVHPTVWIERLINPWLTEVMYALYLFYFPMPLIVLGVMLWRGRYRQTGEELFVLLCCYYTAYLLYFFFPASGPRFTLSGLQSAGLEGIWLSGAIRGFIDMLEPNKLDAFPSLHAGILLSTMMAARRHERALFLVFIPIAAGITVSLVYCRYHYVVDIIAGFVLAGCVNGPARRLHRRLAGALTPHFGKEGLDG